MAYTIDEEQEINQLKEWWKENYKGIVVVFVLTLAVVYGWRYWQHYQVEQAQARSAQYEQLIVSDNAENKQEFQEFIQTHNNSAYAVFALLERARDEVEAKQYAEAEKLLQEALKQSTDSILTSVTALRLSEVQLQLKQYQKALESLQQVSGESWASAKYVLTGDIALAQGEKEQAKASFEQALSVADELEKPLIQVRLNNL